MVNAGESYRRFNTHTCHKHCKNQEESKTGGMTVPSNYIFVLALTCARRDWTLPEMHQVEQHQQILEPTSTHHRYEDKEEFNI